MGVLLRNSILAFVLGRCLKLGWPGHGATSHFIRLFEGAKPPSRLVDAKRKQLARLRILLIEEIVTETLGILDKNLNQLRNRTIRYSRKLTPLSTA